MDPTRIAHAQQQHGLLTSAQLGAHPSRTAGRHGLVVVQPRVWAGQTQPIDVPAQVAAVAASVIGRYALLDRGALWKHGLSAPPEVVRVGVLESTRYRCRPPVEVRRVAEHLLEGRRLLDGVFAVALEVAVLQTAGLEGQQAALPVVEQVLRTRKTTVPRLRGRLRRGVRGSTALRAVLDELVGASLDGAVRQLVAALATRGVSGLLTEVRFTNAAGASAYADVLDEAGKVVLEVDGYLSHVERDRFLADRRRDRWLHAEHGLLTLRIDVVEILEDLDRLADELARTVLERRSTLAA